MMRDGRFVALGSSNRKYPGEALLWLPSCRVNPRCRAVAVDLGRTIDMGEQVAIAAPGILVLTHDDHDHIGGWSGFKGVGLTTLCELWVPYEWGALVHVLAQLDLGQPDNLSVEEERVALEGVGQIVDGGSENPAHLDELTESALGRARELGDSQELRRRLRGLLGSAPLDDEGDDKWRGTPEQVAARAAERAVRLADILYRASLEQVRIRYFSVDHARSSGVTSPWKRFPSVPTVSIANAVEVQLKTPNSTSLATVAYLLYLTVQNRRALCPVLWECGRYPPKVIIWSDSSGDWTRRFPAFSSLLDEVAISTSSHHGSTNPAHDPAWKALASFLANPASVMFLAGGEHTQPNVRSEYLMKVSHDRRGCTRCRHTDPEPQRAHRVIARVSAHGSAYIVAGGCSE